MNTVEITLRLADNLHNSSEKMCYTVREEAFQEGPFAKSNYQKYETLTFTDDFIFCKVLQSDPQLCADLTGLLLDRKVSRTDGPDAQKTIQITSDSKGVRFDVYFEDGDTAYDLEMQKELKTELPKRSRYYQDISDLQQLSPGDPYDKLKENVVIFICLDDPFGKGLFRYSFIRTCEEAPEIKLNDGSRTVFICANGNRKGLRPEMKSFLDYLFGKLSDDKLVQRLNKAVKDARKNSEWKAEYMRLEKCNNCTVMK